MSNTTNKGHVLLGLILGLMVAVFAALIAFMLMTKNTTPINEQAMQEDTIQQPAAVDPNKSLQSKVPLTVDDKKSSLLSSETAKENSSPKANKTSEQTMEDIIQNGLELTPPKKQKKELPEYIDKYGEKKIGTPTEEAISINDRTPDTKPKKPVAETNPNVETDPIANILNQKQNKEKVVKAKPEKDGVFYIQVGSFKSEEQADKQKAVLLMQGMQSQITQAEREGGLVHRVRVGPYYSKKEVDDVTKKLSSEGMAYRVVKTTD